MEAAIEILGYISFGLMMITMPAILWERSFLLKRIQIIERQAEAVLGSDCQSKSLPKSEEPKKLRSGCELGIYG